MRIHADSFLLKTPIAHRGLHDAGAGIPENSYAAFAAAVREGYAIELDVRFSSDGKIVVFHDDSLARMTGENADVAQKTYGELSSLRLLETQEHIPLFEEVLESVDGKVPLLIELKDQHGRKGLTQGTISALKNYKGEFALQSFHPLYLLEMKKLAPDILRGQLGCFYQKFSFSRYIVKNMNLHALTDPDFISYNIDDLPFRKARKKGTALLGWTVRTQEEYNRVRPIVDNFIFEKIRPAKKDDLL